MAAKSNKAKAVKNTVEKVAVATNDVPDGATEPNVDGTVKVFDGAGNVVGSITAEVAEEATTIIQPEEAVAAEPEETATAKEPEVKVEVIETYNDLRLNMTLRKGTVLTMPITRAHDLVSKILVKLI